MLRDAVHAADAAFIRRSGGRLGGDTASVPGPGLPATSPSCRRARGGRMRLWYESPTLTCSVDRLAALSVPSVASLYSLDHECGELRPTHGRRPQLFENLVCSPGSERPFSPPPGLGVCRHSATDNGFLPGRHLHGWKITVLRGAHRKRGGDRARNPCLSGRRRREICWASNDVALPLGARSQPLLRIQGGARKEVRTPASAVWTTAGDG